MSIHRQSCRGRQRRSTPISAFRPPPSSAAGVGMGSSSDSGSGGPSAVRPPLCHRAHSPGGGRIPARPG
eukprot:8338712-Alexandrium_andersonii.AAC.1